MSDSANAREALRRDFLAQTGLTDARRDPLPGDASTRRYERLTTPAGASLMLMDQPPAAESQPCDPAWTPEQRHAHGWNAIARLSAGRIEAFAAVAEHFRKAGLSTPRIEAVDTANGLALIEDFGDALFARVIEDGRSPEPLYLAAVEALAHLHRTAEVPPVLHGSGGDWPLLTYDATALQGGADLFVEWLPKLKPHLSFGDEAVAEWRQAWAPVTARGESGATVIAHRDYHAENLLWMPEQDAVRRVGMIDFQDAVVAHPAWDLHSLLQDARRDVAPEVEVLALDRYFALIDVDREAFLSDYAALAALNEARIIGIFSRLIARDGKPRYGAFLPRMWAHLNANLKKPGLETVRAWFDRHLPEADRQGGAA